MRWGGWIVFVGRFIALLRMLAGFLAGANRLSPGQFFIFNAAGGIVWAHVFGLGGYYLTSAFQRVEGPFAFVAFVFVLGALIYLWRYFKKFMKSGSWAKPKRPSPRRAWSTPSSRSSGRAGPPTAPCSGRAPAPPSDRDREMRRSRRFPRARREPRAQCQTLRARPVAEVAPRTD